jgi:predicted HTH domain antitoxin
LSSGSGAIALSFLKFETEPRKADSNAVSTVNVELAEELLQAADVADAQPSRSASKLIALELFREQRISLGKAAELAGVSVEEFMTFSAERQVPLHYTMADWEADRATARDIKP